jgi:hypothetical protein
MTNSMTAAVVTAMIAALVTMVPTQADAACWYEYICNAWGFCNLYLTCY